MSLSRTVSEINSDFSRKSPIFPTHVYLTPQLKGFPLEFGNDTRDKKTRMMGLPDGQNSFTTSLAV